MIAKIRPRPASSQTWWRGSVLMTCVIDSPGLNHVVSQGEATGASSEVMADTALQEAHSATGSIEPETTARRGCRQSPHTEGRTLSRALRRDGGRSKWFECGTWCRLPFREKSRHSASTCSAIHSKPARGRYLDRRGGRFRPRARHHHRATGAGALRRSTLHRVSPTRSLSIPQALKETAPALRRTGAFFFPRGDARERRPFLITTTSGGDNDARTPGDSSGGGTTEHGPPDSKPGMLPRVCRHPR